MSDPFRPHSDPVARRAEIRERLAASTPGPWAWEEPVMLADRSLCHVLTAPTAEVPYDRLVLRHQAQTWGLHEHDRALIAHAPADLRWLLDELEREIRVSDEAVDRMNVAEGDELASEEDAQRLARERDEARAELERVRGALEKMDEDAGEYADAGWLRLTDVRSWIRRALAGREGE